MNGNSARIGGAETVEHALLVAEQPREQADQQARRDQHERDRARVVAQLPQHAAGRGEGAHAVHRSPSSVSRSSRRAVRGCCAVGVPRLHRSPVASALDEREECGIRIDRARVGEQAVRGRVGDDAPRTHEHQPVAAQRLVHHVAADDDAWCRGRRARGTRPTARRAAAGRARRSARRAPSARASRASRPRARRGVSWPPLSEPTVWLRVVAEADLVDDPVDVAARRADEPGEVARGSGGS